MGLKCKLFFWRKAEVAATDASAPAQPPSLNPISSSEVESELLLEQQAGLTIAVSEPEATQFPTSEPTAKSDWQLCGDTVIGLAHRRKGLPCQDAVAFRNAPRPLLVLSDGAGSAAISERGAQALVIGISRFLQTLEDELAVWLDGDGDALPAQSARWAERLRLHARGLLADLASAERRDVRDVRATLQVAVIGERHVFWWKVGDGAIVVRDTQGLRSLGNQANAKGEFANQTCFVDAAKANDVQFGMLLASEVVGIALMSDGGAEKLVAHDGSKVANRLGQWMDSVAEQRFSIDQIALAFHEPAMWERTSLDDRGIVLASRLVNSRHGELPT